MRYKVKRTGAGRLLMMLAAVLVAGTACQDLDVANTVYPDRERILGTPDEVETLLGGSFVPNLYAPLTAWNGTGFGLAGLISSLYPPLSAEMQASLAGTLSAQWWLDLAEPRQPHQNAAVIAGTIGPHGPRTYWAMMGAASASPNDVLQILDGGMQIIRSEEGTQVDYTPRARAFAKLIQGWSWGYQALVFDEINVVPESIDLEELSFEELQALPVETLKPYDEAIVDALDAIDEAIQIAQANPAVVHFPADGSPPWFGSPTPVSNEQFIQIANTLAARLLVLNARNPAERQAVDWARVLTYTDNGVTDGNDLEVVLSSSRPHILYQRFQGNAPPATTFGGFRWDYRTVGLGDQSGNYQAWIASEPADRDKFEIETPDRRITGPTPDSDGSYTRYRTDDVGFLASRGTYFLSYYQWSRHSIERGLDESDPGHQEGSAAFVTADENALLRAEAILRTAGVTQEALDLINRTRTREHLGESLPPVTGETVPEVGGVCVPRLDNGDCGSVRAALRYERMIELAGIDALRGYADSRGFGLLPDGTAMHYPVPGNVLEQYGLEEYTYGGVGSEWGAVYDPWN